MLSVSLTLYVKWVICSPFDCGDQGRREGGGVWLGPSQGGRGGLQQLAGQSVWTKMKLEKRSICLQFSVLCFWDVSGGRGSHFGISAEDSLVIVADVHVEVWAGGQKLRLNICEQDEGLNRRWELPPSKSCKKQAGWAIAQSPPGSRLLMEETEEEPDPAEGTPEAARGWSPSHG